MKASIAEFNGFQREGTADVEMIATTAATDCAPPVAEAAVASPEETG